MEFFLRVLAENLLRWCFIAMFTLAMWDLVTYFLEKKCQHRNFKTTIVSIGILGTFIGISIGLMDFDTTNIEGSVPQLLDGLKTAFWTSVMGMSFSIVITIIERIKIHASERDVGIAGAIREIKNIHELVGKESKASRDLINKKIDEVKETLNESFQKISEGANKQIIELLNQSISGFNENLTEQFGENFKQLNAACLKLVEWQEQHKQEVDATHQQLQDTIELLKKVEHSLDATAERNKDIHKVYEELKKIIETYDNQTTALTSHLEKYGELADKAKTMFADADTHFTNITTGLNEFNVNFHKQISAQSEMVNTTQETVQTQAQKLEGLGNEIIESTQKMEEAFVNITEKMGEKYTVFLKIVEDIANQEPPQQT